ncbi:MAG: cyclophilin-like fold protein [Synergistaceae bacterium]|nr:cyclophilin-like fold protein [Synergistaceae bacterium]
MKAILALVCMTALFAAISAAEAAPRRIRLSFDGREALVELYDNATAESLEKMLPLTLDFEDFAGEEKIAYTPEKLSTAGMPESYAPKAGEMTVYAPWGNIAIFYKEHGASRGLVPLGRFISGAEQITLMGKNVRLEAAQ